MSAILSPFVGSWPEGVHWECIETLYISSVRKLDRSFDGYTHRRSAALAE